MAVEAEKEATTFGMKQEGNDVESKASSGADETSQQHRDGEVPNASDEEKMPEKPQVAGPGPPPNGQLFTSNVQSSEPR